MPRTARLKTYDDVLRAQEFLNLARDVSLHSHPGLVGRKRDILAAHYGPFSRIHPYTSSERRINTVFASVYQRAFGLVEQHKRDPLPILLATPFERLPDDLAERVAIVFEGLMTEEGTFLPPSF